MSSSTSFSLNNIHTYNDQLNIIDEEGDEHAAKKVSCREIIRSSWKKLKDEIRELFTFHFKEWANAFRCNPNYPLFVLGDIDGFVGLFVNNLATLFAVILNLQLVLESDIIYGKIIPG